MDRSQFIKYLIQEELPYEDTGDKIIIGGNDSVFIKLDSIPEGVEFENIGSVFLQFLETLPKGIKFSNDGPVVLGSLKSLPKETQFINRGGVSLKNIKELPDGIEFNNKGTVSLNSLTSLPKNIIFNNSSNVFLNSLTVKGITKGAEFKNREGILIGRGGQKSLDVDGMSRNRVMNCMIQDIGN
jgi:hypothetical protein